MALKRFGWIISIRSHFSGTGCRRQLFFFRFFSLFFKFYYRLAVALAFSLPLSSSVFPHTKYINTHWLRPAACSISFGTIKHTANQTAHSVRSLSLSIFLYRINFIASWIWFLLKSFSTLASAHALTQNYPTENEKTKTKNPTTTMTTKDKRFSSKVK